MYNCKLLQLCLLLYQTPSLKIFELKKKKKKKTYNSLPSSQTLLYKISSQK
ncbi:hypothetical protein HanRHA438_Chr12g0550031 [Helianthus annuus]|nr:hypothetical protein HanIR_Chr12g0580711 [Helianthus annuus]KAJ0866287.1 hypothetical protein HanRHA438_Chr12g0550031 [Helianthus annuus]